jgi:hypothetical protein
MTRNVMVVGLIAVLVLSLGGAALSVAPAWAEVNASGSEVLALKQEAATTRAEGASTTSSRGWLKSKFLGAAFISKGDARPGGGCAKPSASDP